MRESRALLIQLYTLNYTCHKSTFSQSLKRSLEGEHELRKSLEVDLFHLQGGESERKSVLARKTWLTFLIFLRAIAVTTENDFHQNVY